MSSSSEKIDDQQHKTQRSSRRMKNFMSNKVVKGLKEKMSEVLIATSNCEKMKSWSSDQNNKLAEVVHHALTKCKGNKIEKKKNHEEKYDETRVSSSMEEEEEEEKEELMLSKDSMLKRLNKLAKELEKTMETVGKIEELVRIYSTTVKDDEEEQMSDSADDESESGYCTPDLNLD